RGSDMFFVLPRVPPLRGCTLGYDYAALTGSNFRSPAARPIPIYCAGGGFFQNVADISFLYKIFGTRVFFGHENSFPLALICNTR
ncbi:MAG: hypothetical protein J6J97_06645, partial [Akkermansia sp.]|nr:hypothetical protein [Akkermansia sp.]